MSTVARESVEPALEGPTLTTAATPLWFGGDYNPEQWPEAVWDEDVRLMTRANVSIATVGVFSWARLEPRPGEFDFGWLDRVLDKLHRAGIRVDLATATASPPPWLSHEYPDTLPVRQDGVILWPGSRQHYCPSSPTYRKFAARLVSKLVERYGEHPALAFWHVNNEYGCHVNRCYCDQSAQAFRTWLKRKYGDIATLNSAWGTSFWSQAYSNFDEIVPPRSTPTTVNPTQQIDFDRFSSNELLDCFRMEAAILRAATPHLPITTNFMGFFKPLDYWAWAREVDFVSDDSYPDPADEKSVAFAAMTRDLVRSLKDGQSWLLMEQASSAVNWRERNAVKPKGTNRAWSFQALARGSDGVLYFQWRQSVAGAEKFHSALLPHGGSETRVYREVELLGRELASLGEVRGRRVESSVAIVVDWDSWWAIEQPGSPTAISYLDNLLGWYKELHARNIAVDFVRSTQDLSSYALVLVPHLLIATAAATDSFDRFVREGGVLLVTYQTAVLDENLHLVAGGYLGGLRDTLGITIEEFAPLAGPDSNDPNPSSAPTHFVTSDLLGDFEAYEWTEHLHATTAEAVANFTEGDLAGSPAVTRNVVGDGTAWYVATRPNSAAVGVILEHIIESAGVVGALPTPVAGVEAVRRGDLVFLINHSKAEVAVPIRGYEVLAHTEISDLILPAQGVGVVRVD